MERCLRSGPGEWRGEIAGFSITSGIQSLLKEYEKIKYNTDESKRHIERLKVTRDIVNEILYEPPRLDVIDKALKDHDAKKAAIKEVTIIESGYINY